MQNDNSPWIKTGYLTKRFDKVRNIQTRVDKRQPVMKKITCL